MQCPACQYQFKFLDVVKVVSPYHCPCPVCKSPLTLGRQGKRFAVASAVGGAVIAGAGICLEQSQVVTSAQAFALTAIVFLLAAGAGEWYFWKCGALSIKPLPPGVDSRPF